MAVSMRTQEIEMASDADINVSNTEITVGMQRDAMQGKKRGVVKVVSSHKHAYHVCLAYYYVLIMFLCSLKQLKMQVSKELYSCMLAHTAL